MLTKIKRYLTVPASVRLDVAADRRGLPEHDPGLDRVVDEGVAWLCRAQDQSRLRDGGVARDFSPVRGWSASYPETTGYIVPTLLAYAAECEPITGEQVRQRARRMLDWLVSIQFPEGGFQGGPVDAQPAVPVIFNSGQILFGLAAGVLEFGDAYREAMTRAANWLVETQDPDGCWRKHRSPFAVPGEKTYETHVAWGLLEAARVKQDSRYADAALANVRWAISQQHANGWFDKCCLTDDTQPLTHAIAYALRGVVEGYRYSRDSDLLAAARKTADGLMMAMREDGYLAGRLRSNWRGAVRWVCLTGTAQIAHCLMLLHDETHDTRYRDAGRAASKYVRRAVRVEGSPETRGAVKGSFPFGGGYCTYSYPNWATKFLVDACLLERRLFPKG
jgi:Squalene-hopene cyclase C-terminal domain